MHQVDGRADETALILDAATDAFVAVDAEGVVVRWNAAAERMFGFGREEIVGRPAEETIIPPGARDGFLGRLARYVAADAQRATGERLVLEARHRDGHLVPVEATLCRLDIDGRATYNAFVHDITPRRVAEARLQRLTAVVDCASDAVVVTDGEERITDFNPAAERLLGRCAAEVVGRPFVELVPPREHPAMREGVRRVLAGEVLRDQEGELLHSDGSPVAVALTVAAVRGADGVLLGVSATARDLRRRKQAEADLAAHTARLRRQEREHRRAALLVPAPAPAPAEDADRATVDRVLALMRQELDMEVAWISEIQGGELIFRALDGPRDFFGTGEGDHVPLAGTPCRLVFDGELDGIVHDARTHPLLSGLPVTTAADLGAFVGAPIRRRDGSVYGTLCAGRHAAAPALGDRDARFVHVLAGLLGEQLDRQALEAANRRLTTELTGITALLAALDARDAYTGAHSQAVVALARAVAERLGLDAERVAAVEQVALLHDLGKVGIPDVVLQKAGPLSAAEWELMRQHPSIGARIVGSIGSLVHLAPAVRAEHERWDGDGYPDGLREDQIPVEARITFACDAYHAMTSDRPYRRGMGHAAAAAELREHTGSQFDPAVVAALLDVLAEG